MRKPERRNSSQLRDRGRRGWTESLLLLVLALAAMEAWSQDRDFFAPGVKVLATLESSVSAWSPDGQSLAHMTNDGIWIVEAPDFQRPRRLIRKGHCAAGSCPGQQLSWSPDGKKLAFMDSRPGDGWSTIWVADANGSHVRDLLPPGAPFIVVGSRAVGISGWLSNREIAFYLHCGTGCVSLNKIDVESGTYRHFCTGSLDGAYYWAPTRDQAVSEMHLGGLSLIKREAGELISDATSSSKECREVIEGCTYKEDKMQGEEYRFDAWAPDGKRVLYTGWLCSQGPVIDSQANLYLWVIDSSQREQLVPNAGWAAWSPDGTKIAFLLFGAPRYDSSNRIIGTDFIAGKPFRVYLGIMVAATQAVPTLVSLGNEPLDPERGSEWNFFRPIWSPDSKRLLARNLQEDLLLIQADGSGQRLLTRGAQPCDATCIQWSPDGKRLALWPAGKQFSDESSGLQRFLPPAGREDAALPDTKIIQRYFEQILSKGPEMYSPFLWEYISALEEMGKVETAGEQYRKAIEQVQRSAQWRGTSLEADVKQSYAEFLCRHGQEKEAAEWGTCTPPSRWPHQEDLLRHRSALFAPRVAPWHDGAAQEQETPPQSLGATPPGSSRLPSLYIIEVPEQER